jgi:hypothetical protein
MTSPATAATAGATLDKMTLQKLATKTSAERLQYCALMEIAEADLLAMMNAAGVELKDVSTGSSGAGLPGGVPPLPTGPTDPSAPVHAPAPAPVPASPVTGAPPLGATLGAEPVALGFFPEEIMFQPDNAVAFSLNLVRFSDALWSAVSYSKGKKGVPQDIASCVAMLPPEMGALCGPEVAVSAPSNLIAFDLSVIDAEDEDFALKIPEVMKQLVRLLSTYTAPVRSQSAIMNSYKLANTNKATGTVVCAFLFCRAAQKNPFVPVKPTAP